MKSRAIRSGLFAITIAFFVNGVAQTSETVEVMTLKQCIDYALKNHPTNIMFDNDVKNANQKKLEMLSGYMPQVNGKLTWDDNLKRQTTVIPGAIFGSPEDVKVQFGNQYSTVATVQADQVIYDQTLISGLRAVKPNVELAMLKKFKNEDDLIYTTASSYYQIISYQEKLKLLQENEKKFSEILDMQKLLYEKGVIKKVDFDRVQVALNNIKAQKQVAETSLSLTINSLKNSMGMPVESSLVIADSASSLHEAGLLPENSFDVKSTWDYRIVSKSIMLQEIVLKRARAAYAPTLGFYARYGGQAFGNEFITGFKDWFAFSSIGIGLNVPIFDGFRRSSQIKQSALSLSNTRQNLVLLENSLKLQNQNAVLQLQNSMTTLQSNKANLDLAKDVFDNTSLQYQKGVAGLSDLLNSDYSYKEAQTNYVTSLINYLMAKIEFEKSKGTLKQYLNQL